MSKENKARATTYRRGQSDRVILLGQMAAGILHDASNQMVLVQGALGLAQRSLQDAELSATMKAAQQAADTVGELLKEILSFTRPERGQRQEAGGIYGDDEVWGMLPLIRSSLGGEIGVEAYLNADEDRVPISAVSFQNVLLNLMVNARNAMQGKGAIRLTSRNVTETGHTQWQLTVEDNGPGIAPEDMDSIFEPYFTSSGQGHGLGLMRCKMLVEQAGGHIEGGNGPEAGASFTITLPIMAAGCRRKEEPELILGSGPIAILMADPAQREVFNRMVRALGYDATPMAGLMDLKGLREHPARAVILDAAMAVSVYLRAIPADCPILVIGHFDSVLCRGDAWVRLVRRPVTLLELSHRLQNLLQ